VIIPSENERDLKEIPDNIKADLEIRPVKWIHEVLQLALVHMPEPLSDDEYVSGDEDDRKTEETGAAVGSAIASRH
jgi:ATP-dependent Lon protease